MSIKQYFFSGLSFPSENFDVFSRVKNKLAFDVHDQNQLIKGLKYNNENALSQESHQISQAEGLSWTNCYKLTRFESSFTIVQRSGKNF